MALASWRPPTVSNVESSMPSSPHLEQGLLASWSSNASAWTRLVREGPLRSRVEVTNAAILEAVGPTQSGTLLDLGCGEGWLAHLLVERGWTVLGVDAVSELIETARSGPGELLCAEYEKLGTVLEGASLTAWWQTSRCWERRLPKRLSAIRWGT